MQETRRPKLTATMSESEDESPVEMGPLDAGDERVLWLAEKVSASLGCDVESFVSLVASDGETKNRIEAYIRGARAR